MSCRARRAVSAALAMALVVSACGGAGDVAVPAEAVGADVSPAGDPTVAPPEVPATTAPISEPEATASEAATEAPAAPATPETAATEAPVAPEPAAPEAVAVTLPAVDVFDLTTGLSADLSSFAKPGPTLVWFWAPH